MAQWSQPAYSGNFVSQMNRMATKNTIAVIASTKEKAKAVVQKIADKNCRVLLVSKHDDEYLQLQKEIQFQFPSIEFETIDCMKDGCWEADVIVMNVNEDEEKPVAEMIKEVAIQKVVISFSDKENGCCENDLQKLLHYSRVIKVFNSGSASLSIRGNDAEALQYASSLLKG
jgi:hypothetical protein